MRLEGRQHLLLLSCRALPKPRVKFSSGSLPHTELAAVPASADRRVLATAWLSILRRDPAESGNSRQGGGHKHKKGWIIIEWKFFKFVYLTTVPFAIFNLKTNYTIHCY